MLKKLAAIRCGGLWAEYQEQDQLGQIYSGVLDPMSRGYRGTILAIGLILAAASPQGQSGQDLQYNRQSTVETSLHDIAAALQDANKPDHTAKPCSKDQEDRTSDLCAQWKAADAAGASAVWTERTFWLGISGLVIGFLTLIAAGAAAKFARDAAIHTQTGANAATAAHLAFISSERGTIVINGWQINRAEAPAGGLIAMVCCKNIGKAPVHIVTIAFETTGTPRFPKQLISAKPAATTIGMNEALWIAAPSVRIPTQLPAFGVGQVTYETLGMRYDSFYDFAFYETPDSCGLSYTVTPNQVSQKPRDS